MQLANLTPKMLLTINIAGCKKKTKNKEIKAEKIKDNKCKKKKMKIKNKDLKPYIM